MPATAPTSPPDIAKLAPASVVDAAWRAMLYCLHPRVIWLSVLPLLLTMLCLGGLAWWGWTDAVAQIRVWLDTWSLSQTFLDWLDGLGATGFRAVLAPLLLVSLNTTDRPAEMPTVGVTKVQLPLLVGMKPPQSA